ncbi:MAG: hypothetical protein ACJ72Z_07150 [Pyrinomonadaceae bacterium]
MDEGDERLVCASCGRLIGVSDAYCPDCMAPTGGVSNLDPMQAIVSEGRLFSRATEGRQKPIVLIGVWILFLPFVLVGGFSAISILRQGLGSGFENFIFFWGAIGLAFIGFTVLYKVTTNYLGWTTKPEEEDK